MMSLPPLPEPAAEARWWEQNGFTAHELSLLRSHPNAEKYWGDRDKLSLYTADQMREYGRVVAEECAKLIEAYPHWLGPNAKREIASAIRAKFCAKGE